MRETLQEEPKLEYHDKRTITSPVERCGYGLTPILECDYLQDSNMVKEVQTTNKMIPDNTKGILRP